MSVTVVGTSPSATHGETDFAVCLRHTPKSRNPVERSNRRSCGGACERTQGAGTSASGQLIEAGTGVAASGRHKTTRATRASETRTARGSMRESEGRRTRLAPVALLACAPRAAAAPLLAACRQGGALAVWPWLPTALDGTGRTWCQRRHPSHACMKARGRRCTSRARLTLDRVCKLVCRPRRGRRCTPAASDGDRSAQQASRSCDPFTLN